MIVMLVIIRIVETNLVSYYRIFFSYLLVLLGRCLHTLLY